MGLINAHRKRAGRPALGFVNPLLYQVYAETNGTAFNDIVQGSNKCTESGCWCQTGFDAKPGNPILCICYTTKAPLCLAVEPKPLSNSISCVHFISDP